METLNLRFPHLGEMIFDHLDNQSLSNCKVVCKTWSIYIGEQKFYGKRILKETVKKFHKLSKPWFEFFKKGTTENIMELKNCFDQFQEARNEEPNIDYQFSKEITPLHASACAGNILLYESIHKFAQNKQPKCEDGFEPVIQTICYGHVKMALFIIERLVDKNPEAKNGWTALHIAAKYGRVEVLYGAE